MTFGAENMRGSVEVEKNIGIQKSETQYKMPLFAIFLFEWNKHEFQIVLIGCLL